MPLGVAQTGLLAALGWWPGASFPFPALALFFAAFAAYLVAAVRVKDAPGGTAVIWGFAVLMRLVYLPLTPDLSADLYRYLWDGLVQLQGINPYLFAPSSPELADIRTAWLALLDNPGDLSGHPPLAQILFLAVALAGGAVFQVKLLWLGFDLTTAWLLGRVARITGRSRRLTQLLYLWSPLLLVEVAWNGHVEPVALFGMVLLILLARAPVGAGLAAAAGALVLPPLVLPVPALARRLGVRFLAAFAGAFLVIHLPYVWAGPRIVAGVVHSATTARFMTGPFTLLEAVLPSGAARIAALVLVLGMVVWSTAARFRAERTLFWTLGAALLLTPALQPWYALWILPLAALRWSPPWILLTGLSFLGYWGVDTYQLTGSWPQPWWLRTLMWLPVLLLLAREIEIWWRTRVPLPPTTA